MSSWEKILKSLGLDGVPIFKNLRNDDSVDRLSHRLTVMLLVLFAFILTTKQFVGDPIYCWTPAHFMKDSHDEYTNRCAPFCDQIDTHKGCCAVECLPWCMELGVRMGNINSLLSLILVLYVGLYSVVGISKLAISITWRCDVMW